MITVIDQYSLVGSHGCWCSKISGYTVHDLWQAADSCVTVLGTRPTPGGRAPAPPPQAGNHPLLANVNAVARAVGNLTLSYWAPHYGCPVPEQQADKMLYREHKDAGEVLSRTLTRLPSES